MADDVVECARCGARGCLDCKCECAAPTGVHRLSDLVQRYGDRMWEHNGNAAREQRLEIERALLNMDGLRTASGVATELVQSQLAAARERMANATRALRELLELVDMSELSCRDLDAYKLEAIENAAKRQAREILGRP